MPEYLFLAVSFLLLTALCFVWYLLLQECDATRMCWGCGRDITDEPGVTVVFKDWHFEAYCKKCQEKGVDQWI
jgi:hypothetical protein